MAAARIKYAVVTGAGTGIGKALSLALVARGVRVIAVGRRSAPLEALVKEVKDGEITACSADLTLSSVRPVYSCSAIGGVLSIRTRT